MSRFSLAWILLAGCGGPGAEVTGTVIDIAFGDSAWVYFGEPFIVISNLETDCESVAWVRRNYEAGAAPTEGDAQLLQFAYASDAVTEGRNAVDVAASVESTVVKVDDGVMHPESPIRANAGVITVDKLVDEKVVEGTFEGVIFGEAGDTDGGASVTGSFSAEWCRNLKG